MGDPDVQTSLVTEANFINSGDNPFKLIRDSIKYVYIHTQFLLVSSGMWWFLIAFKYYLWVHRILEKHKGTVSHIENKKVRKPEITISMASIN